MNKVRRVHLSVFSPLSLAETLEVLAHRLVVKMGQVGHPENSNTRKGSTSTWLDLLTLLSLTNFSYESKFIIKY